MSTWLHSPEATDSTFLLVRCQEVIPSGKAKEELGDEMKCEGAVMAEKDHAELFRDLPISVICRRDICNVCHMS